MGAGVQTPTEGYAAVTDVQQLLPHRTYTQTSKPTAEQVTQMIKDIAKIIDSHLRAAGFDPALTGTEDIQVLKHINALGVAAMAESQTMAQAQGDSPIIDRYQAQYEAYLKKIVNGDIEFATAGSAPAAEAEGPSELLESGDRPDPVFTNSEDSRKNQF